MSEFEHFRRWLKCHRLHKYENLFQNFTFQEVREKSCSPSFDGLCFIGQRIKCRKDERTWYDSGSCKEASTEDGRTVVSCP